MAAKKVLITGGAGFLGSHVAQACLSAGHETHVYGRHIDADVRALLPGTHFIESSILEREKIRAACEGIDVVFHIAGITSVAKSIEDPLGTHVVNVDGTLEVLEAARLSGVTRFVFTSSASVYGNTVTSPVTETVECAPRSPYALQKLISEQYLGLWNSMFGLETVIIRPFNIYGPRQRGDAQHSGIITRLFDDLRNGRPVSIFGDGGQTRDFVHVRDIADAIVASGFAPNVSGKAINIGSGVGVTIKEAVQTVCKTLGVPFAPEYKEERQGDIRASVADISLARELLGWEPRVSFQDGIAELGDSLK